MTPPHRELSLQVVPLFWSDLPLETADDAINLLRPGTDVAGSRKVLKASTSLSAHRHRPSVSRLVRRRQSTLAMLDFVSSPLVWTGGVTRWAWTTPMTFTSSMSGRGYALLGAAVAVPLMRRSAGRPAPLWVVQAARPRTVLPPGRAILPMTVSCARRTRTPRYDAIPINLTARWAPREAACAPWSCPMFITRPLRLRCAQSDAGSPHCLEAASEKNVGSSSGAIGLSVVCTS